MPELFTEADAERMVSEGLFERVETEDGEPRYRLTALGIARAESFIQTPEGAEFWGRLSESDGR